MFTIGQLNYLDSVGSTVTLLDGSSVKGGEAQYDSLLNDVNAVANFKSYVKDEVSNKVDDKLATKYPRAINSRYRAKHTEALSFKNSGYTATEDDYPYLKAESLERGITVTQMANLIITATNSYNANVATVERRRVKFNNDVDAATTLDQVNDLWVAAEQAIEGLQNGNR